MQCNLGNCLKPQARVSKPHSAAIRPCYASHIPHLSLYLRDPFRSTGHAEMRGTHIVHVYIPPWL